MKFPLVYDYQVVVEFQDGGKLLNYSDSKRISVDENFQDLFEYMFKHEYGKPYNSLSWYLEPYAKTLYKELESMWMNNAIDPLDLYHNAKYQTFLKEKYASTIIGSIERKVVDNIKKVYPESDGLIYNIVGDYLDIEGWL